MRVVYTREDREKKNVQLTIHKIIKAPTACTRKMFKTKQVKRKFKECNET